MLFFHACLNADVLFGGSASITVGVLKVTEYPEELPWFSYLIKHFSWSSKTWWMNWWPKALKPKWCVCAVIIILYYFLFNVLLSAPTPADSQIKLTMDCSLRQHNWTLFTSIELSLYLLNSYAIANIWNLVSTK